MRILIADDDLVSRSVLERALCGMGHEVAAVGDGLAALAAIMEPDGPRFVILGWRLPGSSGLEVCRTIRLRPAPYVYVLLLASRDHREDIVTGLDAGADDFVTKPIDVLELRARLRPGERVLGLESGLIRTQEALRELSIRDSLTGLWNRRMILDQLRSELHRAEREARPVGVAIADLDLFKSVNDALGHAGGDAVLRDVATRMRTAVRDCDFIGRYGGEEFLLVLPGCDGELGHRVAERVRRRVEEEPVQAGDILVPVTLSVGLACSLGRGVEPEVLIQAADEALYRAKAAGRNRVAEPVLVDGRKRARSVVPAGTGPERPGALKAVRDLPPADVAVGQGS